MYLQKLPTLLMILIVDIKSGRAGDKAKKRKSLAKSRIVGISAKGHTYVSSMLAEFDII